MFHVPEKYRIIKDDIPVLMSNSTYGNNGAFRLKHIGNTLFIIASDGNGWEHVSITVNKGTKTPTWEIMCFIKGLFWEAEDCVVQYHPPQSEYINCHHRCLHLWRKKGYEYPLPPKWMIGPSKEMAHDFRSN